MAKVLISGAAGFIGFHLAEQLLQAGHEVVGFDNFNDYYEVSLKEARWALLGQHSAYSGRRLDLTDADGVMALSLDSRPDAIVHLAAQAGVRYSLENPRAYIETNVTGTFNIMEAARELGVAHLLMASTSSVYGANTEMPYREIHKADLPLTIYAASKKANEAMAHAYAHLHGLPTTMFRFFTVYGPWGRPDMAPIKFAKGIMEGRPIDIYNHGEMYRDFTYVEDLARGIALLVDKPPQKENPVGTSDSLSPVAPWRVVNIGNSEKVKLLDFIEALEDALGKKAQRNYMDMQPGDVPATWADATLLQDLTGYAPQTDVREGTKRFAQWFRDYFGP